MSLRGDLIAAGVAGVVLLAAAWYAKKKVESVAAGAVDKVKSAAAGAVNWVNETGDGAINAAGQYITGDMDWTYWGGHSPQYNYTLPKSMGIEKPGEGW